MGKLVRWTKRRGWEVGPTPYQYRIWGLHLFQLLRFRGVKKRKLRLRDVGPFRKMPAKQIHS